MFKIDALFFKTLCITSIGLHTREKMRLRDIIKKSILNNINYGHHHNELVVFID